MAFVQFAMHIAYKTCFSSKIKKIKCISVNEGVVCCRFLCKRNKLDDNPDDDDNLKIEVGCFRFEFSSGCVERQF